MQGNIIILTIIITNLCCSSFTHGLSLTSNGIESKFVENKSVPGLKNGMDYVKLGSSDLEISRICMGTMTFGEVSVIILSL